MAMIYSFKMYEPIEQATQSIKRYVQYHFHEKKNWALIVLLIYTFVAKIKKKDKHKICSNYYIFSCKRLTYLT